MTATFNRPPIIQLGAAAPLPGPALDQSSINPDVPSHIVAKILEIKLARQLGEGEPVNRTNLQNKIACVENWISSLPPFFSLTDPDRRWDGNHTYIPLQRLQLHCIGFMTQVILLRSILISSGRFSEKGLAETGLESENTGLLHQVIDLSLKAMSLIKDFFIFASHTNRNITWLLFVLLTMPHFYVPC